MSVRVRFLAKDKFRVSLKNSGRRLAVYRSGVSKGDVEIGEIGEMWGFFLIISLSPISPYLPSAFSEFGGLSIHAHSEQFN
jgi:hypothetical protein